MKPQTKDFEFHQEILTIIPLCIKLPNLLLNCWGYKALTKIGSYLGKPLYAGDCTTQMGRITYARILVEMNINRPLPDIIKVQDHNEKLFA